MGGQPGGSIGTASGVSVRRLPQRGLSPGPLPAAGCSAPRGPASRLPSAQPRGDGVVSDSSTGLSHDADGASLPFYLLRQQELEAAATRIRDGAPPRETGSSSEITDARPAPGRFRPSTPWMTRSARASSIGFSEIKQRGDEAAIHAAMRADELLDAGAIVGPDDSRARRCWPLAPRTTHPAPTVLN